MSKFRVAKKKQVANIGPKGSQTIWIKITRDCAINISYNENGVVKNEIVSSFVTTSMGQKLNFRIGDNK